MTLSESAAVEDLEDLYENAPCGYLSLLPDGRIAKLNETFCRWTGYGKEQLIGKRMRDLLTVAGSIFYETHFAPLLRMQGFFNEVALDLVTANREVLPVLANATERRREDGSHVFTRLTVFLAKERRRYERELVQAQAAERAAHERAEAANLALEARIADALKNKLVLEEVAELREQFIAVLGHDLRNPLAAIDAGVSMLMKRGWTDRSATMLQLMKGSISRMTALIDNVLDLTRARLGGGLTLKRDSKKSLLPTLQQVVAEIRTANPNRQIEASFDVAGIYPVDHARMAQLLSNLLGNAVAHGSEEHPIRVRAVMTPISLQIAVSNSGNPIPPDIAERLFQPFYRGERHPTGNGLGLGLYIASQIAQAHGGRIELTSDESETCFTLSIPSPSIVE